MGASSSSTTTSALHKGPQARNDAAGDLGQAELRRVAEQLLLVLSAGRTITLAMAAPRTGPKAVHVRPEGVPGPLDGAPEQHESDGHAGADDTCVQLGGTGN